MKLITPLKTPAKNTEQVIFKLVLFIALPLLAALTVYSFATINARKNEAATKIISDQSGNANKRIASFFDPISRDISYLQTLGNAGKLDPSDPTGIQKTLTLFSKSHLQQVRRIIFQGNETTLVYTISDGLFEKVGNLLTPDSIKFLEKVRSKAEENKIDWDEGALESSILAATVFTSPSNGLSYAIATEANAEEFFKGLSKYITKHLFLLPDLPQRLPSQFQLDDAGRPDISETNDPLILSAYTQWKGNAEKGDEVFRMAFDGKVWWVSIRKLEIKGRELYSGFMLAEAQMLSKFFKGRRIFAFISAISFTVVLIATVFLWRRYQRDIELHALPPAMNKMTDNEVLRTIAAGEDDRLEFKSTLRWNLRTDKPDKARGVRCWWVSRTTGISLASVPISSPTRTNSSCISIISSTST
jgi:hypothetical protein